MMNKKAEILVVNDERHVLDIIRAILTQSGFVVRTAGNVTEAMKNLSQNGAPELLITDIYMPDIDGWSFCRLLRMPEYHEFNRVPVLMMSATFLSDEIGRISLENGANDYLAIPFSAEELLDRTGRLLAGQKAVSSGDVLIVEPDSARREALKAAFIARKLNTSVSDRLNINEYLDKDAPSILVYNPSTDESCAISNIRRIREERPNAVLIILNVKGFPSPPASFLYAGAAAVYDTNIDPGELADATVSAARQSALLQAGTLLKNKIHLLKVEEERYRFLVENIAGAIVRLDADDKIQYASPVIERLTGYAPEELIGRGIEDFVPQEDLPEISAFYKSAIAGERGPFEFRVFDRSGGMHHVRASVQALFADGVFSGSTVLLGDITPEKNARKSLEWERHMLNTLMDNTPDYIYFKDLDSRFLKVNRAKAARHGFKDPAEMFGTNDQDFFSEEHAARARADELRIMETLTPMVDVHERITWPGGRVSWAATSKMPLFDLEGKVMGTVGVSRSITDRKKVEEALQEAEQKYRALVENSQSIIYSIDADGTMTFVSRSWKALLGHGPMEIMGRNFRELIYQEDIPICEGLLRRTAETGAIQEGVEYRIFHRDGTLRWHRSVLTPFYDEQMDLTLFIGNAIDLTESKIAEEGIKALLLEKDLLLREVHHRIKNNMVTISSLLGLQARRIENDMAREALAVAQGRVRGMMMIYDKLYTSKDFRRTSAADYMGELIREICAVSKESSHIEVNHHIEEVDMDSKILFPLGIIVNELLTNSYKYAFPDKQKGSIDISLTKLDEERMELLFHDDGVGLPVGMGPGTSKGFGLNLVQMLTRQLKGSMDYSVDGGTRFRIVFRSA